MADRKWGPAALAVVIALSVAPGVARAGNGRASFKAETEGLPVSTQLGSWAVEDGVARLEFQGGHVVGAGTRFVARYRSPYIQEMEGDCVYESSNHLDDEVVISEAWRSRTRGKAWGRWYEHRHRFRAPGGGIGCVFGNYGTGPPTQLEFRLKGELRTPALLEGYYEIRF